MVTQELQTDIVMTNDALELLTCFQDGLDSVVAQLAEQCAKHRAEKSGIQKRNLEVTVEDVRLSGTIISELVRKMVDDGQIPRTAQDAIQSMNDCLDCK